MLALCVCDGDCEAVVDGDPLPEGVTDMLGDCDAVADTDADALRVADWLAERDGVRLAVALGLRVGVPVRELAWLRDDVGDNVIDEVGVRDWLDVAVRVGVGLWERERVGEVVIDGETVDEGVGDTAQVSLTA